MRARRAASGALGQRAAVVLVAVLLAVNIVGSVHAESARLEPRGQGTAGAGPRGAASADTALEAQTRRVAAQLRCPVCQGLSLADSPSELALEMKDVVRQQLRAGRSPDEVKAYFVEKYGEWVLLEPPRRGINLLAYLLPALAVAAGFAVVWLVLGRWTRGAGGAPADSAEADALD